MNEVWVDPLGNAQIVNNTEVSTESVMQALHDHPEIRALGEWATSAQRRPGNLFERDRYVTPSNIFKIMEVAYDAAEHDDVVSGVLESTESLAFGKMSVDADDDDETDIWNQIAADLDLDSRLREFWRELFTVSQFYCAIWWGRKTYKVSGRSKKGVQRKRVFEDLFVPIGLSVLPPTKVIPVGNFMFNKERLCYLADRAETDAIDAAIFNRNGADPIIEQMIEGKYTPSAFERKQLAADGISPDRLYVMNPRNVFRHTDTRPAHKRWAEVRLKSVFELLDLKNQLRQMDRAHLLGGTNFIVLITKGSDQMPGKPGEIAALKAQVQTVARLPVLVGDHRLKVEIVTPKLDHTLQPERYNGIDARISARLFQMFMTGNFAAGAKGDDSIKLARVVARGLESRRHMLRRALELNVLKPTYDANEQFTDPAKLRFHPKRVALDFDSAFSTYLIDLLNGGHISRESVLEEIDYDQENEFKRKKKEKAEYDDVFMPAVLPAGSPGVAPGGGGKPGGAADNRAKADPKAAGRQGGGNRSGGGSAPGSGQGQPPRNPRKKAA